MNKPATSLKLVALGMVLAGFTQQAAASGFQLFEGNAVNMGDFGAGGAAIAQDASTAYYNPAGLVRLTAPQIVISAVGISSKADFSGKSSVALKHPIAGWQTIHSEQGSASGGGFKIVPAFHYAVPLNNVTVFGFSVTAPFGLATDYDTNSVVRYEATKSDIKTLDVSPSIGVKINDQLSVGAGLDLQRLEATLDSTAALPIFHPVTHQLVGIMDTHSNNVASNWGWGWHAGALYQFSPSTRVGINYVSQVKHSLTGTSTFSNDLFEIISPTLNADITLPATTTLSAYHELNQQWALLSSVTYTQWSVIDNITLNNVASVTSVGGKLQPATTTATLPENFRDTWRVALGTNYKMNDQWLFRAGVGYDQTPVNNENRGVRLPDGDRIAVAVGAHYQPMKALGLDVGYTHLFVKDGDINHTVTTGSQQVTTVGTSKNGADLLGLQLTWSIV